MGVLAIRFLLSFGALDSGDPRRISLHLSPNPLHPVSNL